MSETYDLIVIGAGPGGYVAAIRGAQLGLKCAVIEREQKLGGTCLRVGCIPSKALLETTELLEQSQHSFAERGLIAGEVKVDLPQMMAHKDGVVAQLDGGIQVLLKKHKIDRHFGQKLKSLPAMRNPFNSKPNISSSPPAVFRLRSPAWNRTAIALVPVPKHWPGPIFRSTLLLSVQASLGWSWAPSGGA